jgi:hypothetical protein
MATEGFMFRQFLLAAATFLILVSSVAAQSSEWTFHWTQGQTLSYRVAHVTKAEDVTGNSKTETSTKLNLVKQWKVAGVDADGIATLQLTLLSMRMEMKRTPGDTIVFDSSDPASSDPSLKEQYRQYLGQTIAVLRVDPRGKVVEVKESKFGPAVRYESDPPFKVVLPAAKPQDRLAWDRQFQVKLDPPQGAGESYDFTQKCVCNQTSSNAVKVAFQTIAQKLPEAAQDQLPLLQWQPQGEVVFDIANGRLQSAELRIDKELKEYAGKDTSYRFQSVYREEYTGP